VRAQDSIVVAGVGGGVHCGAGPVIGGGGCDRQSRTAARASATRRHGADKRSWGNQIEEGEVVEHVKGNQNPSRRRRSWSGMAGASGDTAAPWRSRAEKGKRGEKLVCVHAGERTRELCWAGLVHDRVCTLVLMEQHLIY
jgi:hypothetical protein